MEEKGQNYLIPTSYKDEDALDLEYSALRVATVLEALDKAACNLSLIFLDACRSSALPARSLAGAARSLGRGLAKVEAPTGMLISFACAPGSTASDGDGRNGVYTANLLEHLPRGEDVQKVLGYVVSGVQKSTNGAQVPWMSGALARDPSRNCGDIYLIEPHIQGPALAHAAPPSSVEASLAAFLSACKLDAEQQTEVSTALRVIGVKSAAHLYAMEEEDLRDCKLPPVTLRLLQAGLRTMKDDSRMKEAASAATSAASSIVDSIANHSKNNNLEAVVAAMRAHSGHAGVQEAGCRALWNMTLNDGNKVKAGGAGAIEAVVAAMRAHSGYAGVQEAGCSALRNMTANDGNRLKAGGAGAIEAVVAAMRAHSGHAGVQEAGCRALWNMTLNDGNKVKAGAAGAIEAVVAAMRAHGSNANIQQCGRLALDLWQLPSKLSTTPNPVHTPRTTDASGGCCTLQ